MTCRSVSYPKNNTDQKSPVFSIENAGLFLSTNFSNNNAEMPKNEIIIQLNTFTCVCYAANARLYLPKREHKFLYRSRAPPLLVLMSVTKQNQDQEDT